MLYKSGRIVDNSEVNFSLREKKLNQNTRTRGREVPNKYITCLLSTYVSTTCTAKLIRYILKKNELRRNPLCSASLVYLSLGHLLFYNHATAGRKDGVLKPSQNKKLTAEKKTPVLVQLENFSALLNL